MITTVCPSLNNLLRASVKRFDRAVERRRSTTVRCHMLSVGAFTWERLGRILNGRRTMGSVSWNSEQDISSHLLVNQQPFTQTKPCNRNLVPKYRGIERGLKLKLGVPRNFETFVGTRCIALWEGSVGPSVILQSCTTYE